MRSHYLPLYSRLGPYAFTLLHDAAYSRKRKLFEYWGHEASLLPLTSHPLLRWRMDRARSGIGTWGRIAMIVRDQPDLIERVRIAIDERGPLTASDFDGTRGAGSWWGWSETKTAFEYLFWSGEITTATRRNFERVYDRTERVLPKTILDAPTPAVADAQRDLVRIAMRAMGIATEADLRDYFRLDLADARDRVAELVDAHEIEAVEVQGWSQTAYVAPSVVIPRRIAAATLVSPFDSLVWHRARARRLFDFDYRIEIYVPANRRVHGYYVLPFVYGERIVARVDLKSDRAARTLLVRSVHEETHMTRDARRALKDELATMAGWLALERVVHERARVATG